MAINSEDLLHQKNTNVFTVSTTGSEVITEQYFGNGIIRVAVSGFAATPTILKNFPYDFKIMNAEMSAKSFGKASHAVSMYRGNTTVSSTPVSNCSAANFIATFALTASRIVSRPTTINFNKVNVSKIHRLYLLASGASYANMNGIITLKVRPI